MEGKRESTGIVELKNFQQEIYSETLESLKRTGKGAISLFPCGGKTGLLDTMGSSNPVFIH